MKIKMDFVSNSSSTSFVYISDSELSEKTFLDAIGVSPKSPLAKFFKNMHEELSYKIENGQNLNTIEEIENLRNSRFRFTADVLEKMKTSLDEGKKVTIATLNSDGALPESLLCMEIFEIDSDKFFLNAYDNYW